MLKRFEVENFRNFEKSISIDFSSIAGYKYNDNCINNKMLSKLIIYGRNSTGKTNLGRAIIDIKSILGENYYNAKRILSDITNFLNANNMESSARFSYTFEIDGDILEYSYNKSDYNTILNEQFVLNSTEFYNINFTNINLKYDYSNLLKYLDIEKVTIDKYIETINDIENEQNLPFLRWILSNVALNKDSVFNKLKSFIENMEFTHGTTTKLNRDACNSLLTRENAMQNFIDLLEEIGLESNLVMEKNPSGEYELYFKYDNKLVSFYNNASSGMNTFLGLYLFISVVYKKPKFIFIDEFDAFYHYEMAEKFIKIIMHQYPDCQVIFTSHNTNLMTNRLMRPDSLFILSTDGRLTPLSNATTRELREAHNLEKMYISGEFDEYE